MKYILLFVLLPTLLCRTTTDHDRAAAMEGTWVEVTMKTDTLVFTPVGNKSYLVLNRGNELRNGFSRPKYRSGPYDYKLLDSDSIALRWSASSDSRYEKYYFKQTGNTLSMEKFFDLNNQKSLLTFERIK